MKYVQINAYSGGWAESIIFKKHRELMARGDESWVFWARGSHEQDEHAQKIASYPEVCFDVIRTRIDGRAGFHSRGITKRLIKRLEEINPDVVHLHELLGYYINVEMLFTWLSKQQCKVVWTLHDCWPFTGQCNHFSYVGCEQWMTACAACDSCPQKNEYPETWFGGDRSVRWSFEQKRRLFTLLPPERMRLIAPSHWIASLARKSFLSKYEIEVVHNEPNRAVFKPTPSDYRQRYNVGDRFLVLGVASKWSNRKGLSDFERLARVLDEDQFVVMVIGLSKKQCKRLDGRIIALERTDSPRQLAEAYTAADVLFNPTLEDNLPTVNLEAEACGTPVVTYDTGGCRETIKLPASRLVTSFDMAVKEIQFLSSEQGDNDV